VTSHPRPVATRLTWAVRTYAWILVMFGLLFAAGTLVVAPVTPTYQSSALVVAREIAVEREVLPRLGVAVFASGEVAAAVAGDPAVNGDVDGLIPDRLSVVAAEDSIVFVVQARDDDPTDAARLADLAAAAFVEELNLGGAGVGEFALQAEAVVPNRPLPELGNPQRAVLGAVAGLLVGLGLVTLLAAARRPVLTGEDVAEAAGVPMLGSLQMALLPPAAYPGQFAAEGLATLARRLASVPAGRLLLIAPRSAASVRRRVYVLVAVALGLLRTLRLDAPEELLEAVREHRRAVEDTRPDGQRPVRDTDAGELVLTDEGSGPSMIDPVRTALTVVAFARRGVSRRRLRILTSGYVDGEVLGVVLVDVRPRMRHDAARRASAGARPPRPADSSAAPAEARPVMDVPSSEPTS
jgi:hypothetical protein